MANPKPRPRDLYWDYFVERFAAPEHYNMPYVKTEADFPQLRRLLSSELGPRLTLEVWKHGVDNYLRSEVSGGHTLKHLCSKFVFYYRAPADRFGQPKKVSGNGFARVGSAEYANMAWQVQFVMHVNSLNLPKEKQAKLYELLEAVHENEIKTEAVAYQWLEEIQAE